MRMVTCNARAVLSIRKAYSISHIAPFCVGEHSMAYCVSSHLQIEVLRHLPPVKKHFKGECKIPGKAVDTSRHELPVQAVHVEGSGKELLGRHLHGRKEP